jgi:biotin synthase
MNYFSLAQDLYKKAIDKQISPEDLDTVIQWPIESLSLLFAASDQVRRHFFGNTVDPCSIMNVKSGQCSEDCAFCSQSIHNQAEIATHGLSEEGEILENYQQAQDHHVSFCVVSSGRGHSLSEIQKIAQTVRATQGEMHASLGILNQEKFGILRDAGVVCYNHNLETSREYFNQIVTTHTYDDRIQTVKQAKQSGMRVCSGGIFGIGESWDDRKSLALELKQLDVDVVPINFLHAIPGTRVAPLKESPVELLKIVALFRLALPEKVIKVCGGRETNLGSFQSMIFFAGANGYITGNYLTTSGDPVESDDQMIASLGLVKKVS